MGWDDDAGARRYGAGLLTGERVRLRALHEDDLPDLVRWWGSPEWAVLQQTVVRPRPADDIAEQFRSWSANETPGSVGFSVVDRASDALVGHVTLYGASLPVRAGRLAVMIGAEHVGNGLGSDAVRVLSRYGFAAMGLNRIELGVAGFNDRARRTYERAGYVVEGVRRAALFHDGRFHDEVLMAALAADRRG